ncbi:unnamed protein product, partial [Prorocentrum cordatum]
GHADSMEGEIVRTLNELHLGQPWHPASHPQSIAAGQRLAQDNVRDAVRRFGSPPEGLTGSGALEELRALSDYAGESATVAPLDFDNINSLSLPDEGFKPVPLDALGGDAGRKIAERLHGMMLSQSEGRARIESEGPGKLYTDPALRNPKLYVQLLRILERRNLLGFYKDKCCNVGAFSVCKKSGKLRLILDGRHASLQFQVPDKVDLASGATFAGLHVDGGKPIAVAEVDLADAFYTMLLHPKFRRYFALPGCRAGLLGLESTADGRRLAGTDLVYPCFRCPPMGCSFSLWICQAMLDGMALKVPQLSLANRFVDRRPVPQVSEGVFHTECVDNAISLSTDLETAAAAASAVDPNLRAAGLPTHGVECSFGAVALGWQFEEKSPIIGLNPALRWKLRLAFVELCRNGYASGKTISRAESEMSHRPHAFKSATSADPFTPESVLTIDCSGNPKAPIKESLEVPVEEPVKESMMKGVHVEEEMVNDIEMGRVCRQLAALSLASGAAFFWRWVTSERNSADRASRNLPGVGYASAAADPCCLGAAAGRPSRVSGHGGPAGESWADIGPPPGLEEEARQPRGWSWRDRLQRSFLELKAVKDRATLSYQARCRAFLTWSTKARLSVASITDLWADWKVANDSLAAARTAVLTSVLGLGPSETLSLRVQSVVQSVRAGPQHLGMYSILLLPAKLRVMSKTQGRDTSLQVDNQEFSGVDPLLVCLVERRAVDAPLLYLDMMFWVRALLQAGAALGLGALSPPMLCQLRHGGASPGWPTNAWEFGNIRKRRQGEAVRSLMQYARDGRVQVELRHPVQNLSSWAHLTDSKVYLEIFSGSGNWSRALRRSMTSRLAPRVFELDVEYEPTVGDLSRRRAQCVVRGWLRGGLLQGVWLGMPCSSWSRARNRPNGPPPLRDAAHVLGLPNLSSADSLKVETGN